MRLYDTLAGDKRPLIPLLFPGEKFSGVREALQTKSEKDADALPGEA
ncbi:hypothetical protein dsmv_2985 [Desulfococcus multivorans DSM 2059]|uniref:Uncharacterized protein n=1 Tax=Desulfococcus multivorans DSM 2059 TaxID=1121405 RepID=S7UUP5_DESML|nr:hypothetical protein dsmv_2985 [Desulfococcus multivorans DSM 2059]SJZ98120.1 hypothetical protein SAMN02745446_02310 [Desulfococcus multivorans DSM 2059]